MIYWGILIIAVVIFILGGLTILYHLVFGLDKTALTDKYTWGANIQGLLAFSAFGNGLLTLISALIILVGADMPAVVVQWGAAIALGCLIAGIVVMGADLGVPMRALKIATGGRPNSPLFIDFVTMILLVILSLVMIFVLSTGGVGSIAVLKAVAYITLIISVLFMSSHTLLVVPKFAAGYKGAPFFSLETVVCALWSGAAILAIICKLTVPGLNAFVLPIMSVMTVIALITGFSSRISASLAGNKSHNTAFVGLALISMILMIVWDLTAANEFIWILAAVLAVIAVYVEKSDSLIYNQMHFMTEGPHQFELEEKPSYKPTMTEIGNLLCGVGLIVLIPYVVDIIFNGLPL